MKNQIRGKDGVRRDKEVWKKRHFIFMKAVWNMEIFVSRFCPVESIYHRTGTGQPQERMTCLDDIGQALPLATLLLVQQKQVCFVVRMGAGMEIIHGPSGKGSHLPRLICLWPLSNTQPASNRDQMLGFQYGTIPVGNLPDTWWHVDPSPTLDLFPPGSSINLSWLEFRHIPT